MNRRKIAPGISALLLLVVTIMMVRDARHIDSTNAGRVAVPGAHVAAPSPHATSAPPAPDLPASGSWEQVPSASVDFAGTEVDPREWGVYDGPGNQGVGKRRPSAVTIADDQLRITGKGDTSGGLAQMHSQTYGRWVVQARMEKGQGYGPAILLWPDSERWPVDGEIDIVEMPEGDRSTAVLSAHWGRDNRQSSQDVFGDFSRWHTFAVDWLPDRVVYYIDGVERYRITDPAAIPHKPMHLAVQNDIGACGSWIGCRDGTTPPSVSLYVNAVRVYRPA